MNPPGPWTTSDFQRLLAEHQQLIDLANDLEYHLYSLGEAAPESPVTACQQVAGTLIQALRAYLFRQDQQVLPLLESLLSDRGQT